MNALLRHPNRYLAAHWLVTGALAGALFLPAVQRTMAPAAHAWRTVTLLTGQVVSVQRDGAVRSAGGTYLEQLGGPDQYAIPTGLAQRALRAPDASSQGGFIDTTLFDVTYLAANGYDDASTDRVPVIVQFTDRAAAAQAMRRGVVDGGIHLTYLFEYVPDALGYVRKSGPFVPLSSAPPTGIRAIFLNAMLHDVPDDALAPTQSGAGPLLNEALPIIGADEARKHGLTGQGIKIAIVDTGIDGTHADLKGRIVAAKDFSTDGDTHDNMGHGTHVAGIAAGTGAASDGKYGGVAPAALLINAKALGRGGSGSMGGIMKAMEWAADQGARIENLSLGGGATDGTDPLSQDVNQISAKKNVLFVIAAGNSGPRGKVSTPAVANAALAVAAIDKQRALAPFSSQGPRMGDMAVKPEIAAPGVRITAPRANHGSEDPYVTYSGTSMATPMVTGAAALVMQLHPDWSAAQVKNALMNGATPIGDSNAYVSVYEQGTGVVDLRNMVQQQLLIQPAALSFGVVKRNEERTATVTLQNLTTQPLIVNLSGEVHKTQGVTPPTLSLSAASVTVPPASTLPIQVRVKGAGTGTFSGDLVATSAQKTLARVAVGFTIR